MCNEPRAATTPRDPSTPVKTWKSVKSISMEELRRSGCCSSAHASCLSMRKHNRRGAHAHTRTHARTQLNQTFKNPWTTSTLRAIFSPSSRLLPGGFTKQGQSAGFRRSQQVAASRRSHAIHFLPSSTTATLTAKYFAFT